MTELSTTYLGLELAHPIVASASPLTGSIESLVELEAAGAAAVVLPSLFEEEIDHESRAFDHHMTFAADFNVEASGGYLPDISGAASVHDLFDLVTRAKEALRIPVIASLNGTSDGGWTAYAKGFAERGADALELNIYLVAADPDATGPEIEDRYLRLVAQVREAVDLPLAVKIGPQFSSPANMARRLADAGADGLVVFNRFYQPDIDLGSLEVATDLHLSSSEEMRLTLRWIAIMAGRVDADLAATTGVHTADDVVKLILAGADVTMMTSALLAHGPEHLTEVIDDVRRWFTERGYESLRQARGSVSQASVPDPETFERANYLQTITGYAPPA
jgi:dihydroorotate dehydrogenase (fumarate)